MSAANDRRFDVVTGGRTFKFNVSSGASHWREVILTECARVGYSTENISFDSPNRLKSNVVMFNSPYGATTTPTKIPSSKHQRVRTLGESPSSALSASRRTTPTSAPSSSSKRPVALAAQNFRPISTPSPLKAGTPTSLGMVGSATHASASNRMGAGATLGGSGGKKLNFR